MFVASVPSCAHQCYGSEQSSIPGEVTPQSVRLPIVAVVEVCVLRYRHEDSVDCIVGASQSYGAHRHHRIVPTPCLLPVPVFLYPVEGAAHILLCEQSTVWQHSQGTQRHRVVAGELVNTHWVVGLQSPFCKESALLPTQYRYHPVMAVVPTSL